MIEYKREYENQEAEIRDSWHGTAIGFLCVLLMGLAFNEFTYRDTYFGSSQLVRRAFIVGLGLAFAVYLFLVKDAEGYEPLEKIRFGLFGTLFCCILSFWLVPFSNRFLPAMLDSSPVEAVIIKATPGNKIGLGKKERGAYDFTDLLLEIQTDEVAMDNNKPEVDRPEIRLEDYDAQKFPLGSIITVQLCRGRWGQDFILPLE